MKMRISNSIKLITLSFYFFISIINASRFNIINLDERAICKIKTSCLGCLLLTHCSWCPTENKCFSEHLPGFGDYCEKEKIRHPNYEMSIEENAICACSGGELENNCRPPGVTGPECSGRGSCICGRCFCDANPDPINPSKAIMGEHCEYDNFSCDDPKCNEGPYSIYDKMNEQNNFDETEK